ncbi:MAG: heat-inducible transcription repressor HrcA [Caldilineaceae bacterium]|nr:heat-inducible transcription repressor HrcA [Caldilineaceae bacterium]
MRAREELAERRRHILNIVIQEFVKTAQPVGSNTIVQNYDLGVSAATIRNDLAFLEEEGLLTHPHTSAGRVPTDAGYRYFVQHLLTDVELPHDERRAIRIQFKQARQELDQWLRLSTAVLARTSQSAALATPPRSAKSHFKHLELVGIHDAKVLLVLVLQDGTVKQQLLDLDEPMEQSELSQVSNELNDQLARGDTATVAAKNDLLSPFARQVAVLIREIMERIDNQMSGQIYRDGLVQILEAPEFMGTDHVRKIVRVFEQRTLLEQVIGEYSDNTTDIQVMIAGEGRYAELQDISLVIGRYGITDRATGIVGVIGPMRMPYGRTISAVRFVSTLMSEMVEDMYAD